MPIWGRFIFCALGFIAIMTGIRIFQRNMQARKWSTIKGKILESSVVGFDEDFISVKYEYTVMGIRYIGDRFNVGQSSVGNASEIIKRYKPGAIVDVIYNPRDPRESALTQDPMLVPIFMASVGALFLLFGLLASF